MVHRGFVLAWTAGGFNEQLMGWLEGVLGAATPAAATSAASQQQQQPQRRPVTVLVTGHSLGGALANLCAYEIATRWPGKFRSFPRSSWCTAAS